MLSDMFIDLLKTKTHINWFFFRKSKHKSIYMSNKKSSNSQLCFFDARLANDQEAATQHHGSAQRRRTS